MKQGDLKTMSIEQLRTLNQEVITTLASKLAAEREHLEERLRQLNQRSNVWRKSGVEHARRPYPPVLPKFRNPLQPSETWSGRGKQPRWLTEQLRSGKQIDNFRIGSRGDTNRQRRRMGLAH